MYFDKYLVTLFFALIVTITSAQAKDETAPVAALRVMEPIAGPVMPKRNEFRRREHSQLIWDLQNRRLERRIYILHEPLPLQSLTMRFEPDMSTPLGRAVGSGDAGPIKGRGVLTWRARGAISYGTKSIVAQYRGELKDGYFQGNGLWLHQSGTTYQGQWKNGLMHGLGQLFLPDGTAYTGHFERGEPEGQGVLIAANGDVHDGAFVAGIAEGFGQVAREDGTVFAAIFHGGEIVPKSKSPALPDWPLSSIKIKNQSQPQGLSVSVTASGKMPMCCDVGPPTLGYRAISKPQHLLIQPNDEQIMDVWYGRKNIVIGDAITFGWHRKSAGSYALLNYLSNHIVPVRLHVGLKNRSSRSVRVESAYLDMVYSRLDARPALQAIDREPLAYVNFNYVLENYGWANARDAQLDFSFQDQSGKPQLKGGPIVIGDVERVDVFSFGDALERAGVRSEAFNCDSMACVRKAVKNGHFGELGPYVHESTEPGKESTYGVRVGGKISYNWTNADGQNLHSKSPFEAFLRFGMFVSKAECEGGDFRTIRGFKPLNLAVQKGSRRIPVDIDGRVDRGKLERWRIEFQGRKSSTHEFTVVFVLSDGREVRSRLIKLNYFKPREYDWNDGKFIFNVC